MLSRVLTSIAGVAFALGLLFYGMGDSYSPKNEGLQTLGLVLGIGGLIGLAIGIFMYRAGEEKLEAEARARYGADRS